MKRCARCRWHLPPGAGLTGAALAVAVAFAVAAVALLRLGALVAPAALVLLALVLVLAGVAREGAGDAADGAADALGERADDAVPAVVLVAAGGTAPAGQHPPDRLGSLGNAV